jgi:hypothetical protein
MFKFKITCKELTIKVIFIGELPSGVYIFKDIFGKRFYAYEGEIYESYPIKGRSIPLNMSLTIVDNFEEPKDTFLA